MIHFLQPSILLLAGLVPVLMWLAAWRRRPASGLGRDGRAWTLRHRPSARAFWRPQLLVAAGALLLVMALARPVWRLEPEPATQTRRDTVFLLDVSNSMLATDRSPNRLEDARTSIRETVDQLPSSDRVALVLFAGSSSIACPLTDDRRFFLEKLATAGPDKVEHGGTRIGDALVKVADFVLEPGQDGFHDVILLTDGGDHESQPPQAVAALNEAGAGLVVVGLGDPRTGTRIPDPYAGPDDPPDFLMHDGAEVWVPMEPEVLEAMARASERGLWVNAGDGPYDLATVYKAFLRQAPRLEIELSDVRRWREEFQWFLLLGVLCLLAASRLATSGSPDSSAAPAATERGFEPRARWWRRQAGAVGLLMATLLLTASKRADEQPAEAFNPQADVAELWRTGHEWFAAGRYGEAAESWRAAVADPPRTRTERLQQSRLMHNAGVALAREAELPAGTAVARMELLQQASDLFLEAARLDPRDHAAAGNLLWSRQQLEGLREAAAQAEADQAEQEEADADRETDEGEDGDPDGEPAEGDETGDEDAPEAGEDRRGDASMTTVTDLDNRDLPPPSVAPEDIIREELEAQQERLRERPRQPSREVERDW